MGVMFTLMETVAHCGIFCEGLELLVERVNYGREFFVGVVPKGA